LFSEVLTWENCLKYAKQNNPTIKIAQEKINQSHLQISITKKNLAPNIDFSMSSSKNSQNKNNDMTDSYSIAYKQTIFDNKKNYYNIQSLEKNLLMAKADFLNTSSQLRLQLRTAFINLFYAEESLKLSEEINKIRKSDYELVKMKYESGIENKGSLLLSEAQLVDSEANVKKARLDVSKMTQSLASLMGNILYSSSTLQVQCSFEIKENLKNIPNFEVIADSTPAIQSLRLKKESESFNLKLQSLKISPSVSVSASLGESDNTFFSKNDLTNAFGVNLSIPIFQGNLRKDKIEQAKSTYNQSVFNIENSRNEIINSLTTKWIELQKSLDDVNTQNKFLEAYKNRSEITRAKYSIGLVSFDDWTIIEDNLINATKSYLSTQVQTLQKEAEWIQTKGGDLDYE
jgi:outer membrane protein TolC